MATTKYPTLEEALELHRALIDRFGGAEGVRDKGALESALFRARTGYYDTLAAEAAALMQSLAINHPFIDGNKRVAFALTAIFLRMNGYRIVASADDAEHLVVELVIRRSAPLEDIERWLAGHMEQA